MIRISFLIYILILIPDAFTTVTNRIIGGENAKEGQFPFMASIQYFGYHNCGGVILNQRWILTTAHCLYNRAEQFLNVIVGSTMYVKEKRESSYSVELINYHEHFFGINPNDIGLIKVSENIKFSINVQPVKLNPKIIEGNEEVIVIGWGYEGLPDKNPETLKWLRSKTISYQECQKVFFALHISYSQICTFTKIGEGICIGDSGGPVLWEGQVAGIISHSMPCAKGFPDISTRVTNYLDWISSRINK